MATTVETQRLISVSLGKIAQSRGQRGGINLHKNLLVATVLHKARAAYMIETFNYQQQQHQMSLQQQKSHSEQMLMQQQQAIQHNEPYTPVEEVCEVSCESEVGQCSVASASQSSALESQCCVSSALCEESTPEPLVCQQCEPVLVCQDCQPDPECDSPCSEQKESSNILSHPCDYISPEPSMAECKLSVSVDKENAIPDVRTSQLAEADSSSDLHLDAANRLSQEASMGLNSFSKDSYSSCPVQSPVVMSGTTTCTGILKRRRDDCNYLSDGSSANKKSRTSLESSSILKSSPFFASFTSEASDYSTDESDTESDSEVCSCPVPMQTETTQISNLVNIFNSGFSGLCCGELSSNPGECDYDCDFESTAPPQYTTLTQLRPDSTVPNKTLNRSMPESSLLCSTEVGRLDSLQSAIILSA